MSHIKHASIEDIELIVPLFDKYRMFYKQASDMDTARTFLTHRLNNKDAVIFIFITDENDAAGFTQLYPLFSSTRMRKLWLLNDLFVDEHYRGKGYSIELINEAKVFCRSTDACGMILETSKENEIGNNLYLKTNFVIDTEHNYYSWNTNEL